MALRNVRELGDPCLRKVCKEVKNINARTKILIDDMLQVGVLKRIVVIDIGDGPIIMINPEIIEKDGEQTGYEGCLSLPGKSGVVTRSNHVVVRAYDENMELYELEGTELLARAIQHECDHLDGIMYVDKVEGRIYDNEELEDE